MYRKKNIESKSVGQESYILAQDNTLVFVSKKTALNILHNDVHQTSNLPYNVSKVERLGSDQFILMGHQKFQTGLLTGDYSLSPVVEGFDFYEFSATQQAGISTRTISYSPLVTESSFYDVPSKKIRWSVQQDGFFHFVDQYLFSVEKGYSISQVSVHDGSIVWNFEKRFDPWKDVGGTEKETEVSSFIGVENDRLWISLTNGNVLILDMKTGHEINVIDLSGIFKDKQPYPFSDISTLKLDAARHVIVGLKVRGYLEIDTKQQKAEFYDLTKDFSDQAIVSSSGNSGAAGDIVLDGEYIYFIDKDNLKVGAFSTSSRKVVWSYDFRLNDGNIRPMSIKIEGTALCVLDGNGQIHLFERTA